MADQIDFQYNCCKDEPHAVLRNKNWKKYDQIIAWIASHCNSHYCSRGPHRLYKTILEWSTHLGTSNGVFLSRQRCKSLEEHEYAEQRPSSGRLGQETQVTAGYLHQDYCRTADDASVM